jgi:phosphate transport system substrate-binding protein
MRGIIRTCGTALVVLALSAPVALSAASAGAAVGSTAATCKKLKPATLNGSGSSLQYAYDTQIIVDFKKICGPVTVNYASKGSGTGRQELASQVTDFAGSDAPYSASEQPTIKGGPVLYFPTVADPIAISYNLSSVKNPLQFSADTLAKIFTGAITTWNDPQIAKENPGVKLPSSKITPVVRSDSSGTTQNFTTFLTKAAPSSYTLGASSKPAWPSGNQQGAQNTGVAQIIQSTDGAIGYVDYSDGKAIGLVMGKIQNSAGKYVAPSTAGAALAVKGATVNADLTYDPINVSGAKTYPITSPTYIIAYTTQTDAAKGNALKAFLNYIYGPGQVTAPTVDYAPISSTLRTQAMAQLNAMVLPS